MDGSYDIQDGMDVLDTGGAKVGKVSRIFSGQPMGSAASTTETGLTSFPDADTSGTYGTSGTANTYGDAGDSGSTGNDVGAFGMAEETVETGNIGATVGGSSDMGFTGSNTGSTGPANERFETTGALGGDADVAGATLTPSNTKYFEVHHGGILGIGGTSLYIPFSAVEAVSPGDSVTINCTADEAAQQFAQEPAPLEPANQ